MLADYMLTLMADTNSLFYNSDYVETKDKKVNLDDINDIEETGKNAGSAAGKRNDSPGAKPTQEDSGTAKNAPPPGGSLAAMLAAARARMNAANANA